MTDETRSGPIATLLGVWRRNQDLLRNAGSLAATAGLTSVFGFVYWIVAARDYTKNEVGYGAAAVSAMTLLGTIGMFGLGTMLIGELPRRQDRGGLFSATLLASGFGSLLLGLGYPLVVGAFGSHIPEISGTAGRVALFAVGAALTGATLVLDDGTIGLMRGGVQLWRNVAASAIKLAILPIAALVLHDAFGVGLVLAWVLGTVLSLIPTAIMLRRGGARIFHPPDWALLRKFFKVALAHNWLNLAITTPPKLIPVLVITVISPADTAVFYVALMMASFLFMVPSSLSTVLFAIASASPELIAEKLRFVLRLSVLIGLPAMAVLALGARLALGLFGSDYARLGAVPLLLLILTYIPGIPKTQYIAVCRATGQVTRAAVVLAIGAACEMASVVIGGKLGGLNGLSLGYLIVVMVEGIVTTPTVFRAAYIRGKRRKAATEAMAALPVVVNIPDERELTELLSFYSAAVAEGHALDAATEVWRTGSFPALEPDPDPEADADAGPGPGPGTGRVDEPADPRPRKAGYRGRQQAGLDALISLATPVPPELQVKRTEPGE